MDGEENKLAAPVDVVNYVRAERARGASDEAIRNALLSNGWKVEDIDWGISEEDSTLRASPHVDAPNSSRKNRTKIFRLTLISLFVLSSLGMIIHEAFLWLWFIGAALGILYVLAFCVAGIIHFFKHDNASPRYFKHAALWLLYFGLVGFGSCLVNLSSVSF